MKSWKKELFTLPNLMSFVRLGLIPVYLELYQNGQSFAAGTVLALSCLTDLMDGKIARQFQMVSTVGKVLDPLADKATQISLVLCLSHQHPILIPVCGLLLIKEVFQLLALLLALRRRKYLNGALWAGKLSTTVVFVSLILLVCFPRLPVPFVTTLAALDAGFLLYAFLAYVWAYYGRHPKTEEF